MALNATVPVISLTGYYSGEVINQQLSYRKDAPLFCFSEKYTVTLLLRVVNGHITFGN